MHRYPNYIKNVSDYYNSLSENGKYATQTPNNKGKSKSKYVESVFTLVLIPYFDNGEFNTVLDFGCGTGVFTQRLTNHAQHVTGVDISENLIQKAQTMYQNNHAIDFQLINQEELPFPNNYFDAVVAREVLCYVPDNQLSLVLSELFRVMKPSGKLFWLEQVSNTPFWQKNPASPYMVRRSPAQILEFVNQAGFTLNHQRKVRTPRFFLIYIAWFRLLPQFLINRIIPLEILWHRFFNQPSRRWWNELFMIEK